MLVFQPHIVIAGLAFTAPCVTIVGNLQGCCHAFVACVLRFSHTFVSGGLNSKLPPRPREHIPLTYWAPSTASSLCRRSLSSTHLQAPGHPRRRAGRYYPAAGHGVKILHAAPSPTSPLRTLTSPPSFTPSRSTSPSTTRAVSVDMFGFVC